MSALTNTDPGQGPWLPDDTFGARLALIRQRKGWNIAEAARACDIDPQSWSNWESDERRPRDFQGATRKIAEASGCHPIWLMAGDAAVPRNRCFSPLSQVADLPGQMELAFGPAPELVLVGQ